MTHLLRPLWYPLLALLMVGPSKAAVDYDIVYVRQPRFGDNENSLWPEVFHPARLDPGADLMLLHTNGTEEVLVSSGGIGSITDPFVSFDGQWCYYVYFTNLLDSALNHQRDDLPLEGSDIYRVHFQSREIERLTHQEFTPNLGAGNWDESNPVDPPAEFNRLGYGIINLGPCPLPGGRVAFTSNRNGYQPTQSFTAPCLQLFVMDEDGQNVEWIAPMNIGSALHPTPLRDGRLMFSSYESQGLRDRRLWGIWSIYPDGRRWAPVVSAFRSPQAFHFMTQLSGGDLVVVDYYNLNNNGFGALYRFPVAPPPNTPAFHGAFPDNNPPIDQTVGGGFSYPFKMAFTPYGMYSITPFTHGNDEAAPVGEDGVRVGKFTHPSAAPDQNLLCVWTPGPANDLNRPTPLPYYDAGLYLIPNGDVVASPADLVLIKNDPNYNEAWPRAVAPYSAVHGVDEPDALPWLPNDGTLHPELPKGTPYGIVGTSSFYKRESFPGFVVPWADDFDGLDAFNTTQNGQNSNWSYQGSDAGRYDNSDIFAVRILSMEPNTHRSYGPNAGIQYFSHANERLRILGEIPLRKYHADGSPVLDPEGHPDTSFMAKIPADTPFTFQTLDENGAVLNMAQTWHQVRPGEIRKDCGGCHAHSQTPLPIELTAAGQPDYEVADLTAVTTWLSSIGSNRTVAVPLSEPVVNVEFLRDIRPILERSCVPCHTSASNQPPGNLVLDDYSLYDGLPGDYKRLADDAEAQWGHPPLVTVGGNPVWRQQNASRYIRKFQSRRSLLAWKVFGKRLDGWSNADHPTESVPGDPATLPAGAEINAADLNFTGTIMPPPISGVPGLSADEKRLFLRWIDLGCPINHGALAGGDNGDFGWFLDDLRPTLSIQTPRRNGQVTPLKEIRVGFADGYSGIDRSTLSVTADFTVNGLPPGTELAGSGHLAEAGVLVIPLDVPQINMAKSHVTAAVFDHQGNKKTTRTRFWVAPAGDDLDVVHVDATDVSSERLTLRFRDDSADANHAVLASTTLGASAVWLPCTLLDYVEEPNHIRRLEVQLPSGADQFFLRVEKP